MDLLKGYGSDDSSASSSSASSDGKAEPPAAAAAAAPRKVSAVAPPSKLHSKPATKASKGKRGGKRILSLGAVLPPEIFDRLTRPPEEDDSSTSSFEGAAGAGHRKNNGGGQSKKRKRRPDNDKERKPASNSSDKNGDVDRTGLNSLLSELRSTPLQVSTKKPGTTTAKKDQTTNASNDETSVKLGMAFMSYTSSTTTKKKINEVVDVHAVPKKSAQQMISEQGGDEPTSKPTPPPAPARPLFSRMSAAAPVAPSFKRTIPPQYAEASSMPEYPVASQPDVNAEAPVAATSSTTSAQSSYNNYGSGTAPKSRKQRRDEERALRSGRAFNDNSATATTMAAEIYQPAPTEFAPTAHAAAIASKAARHRGVAAGGGGSVKNIAMYDPSSGTDVKGMGVTGKHRSKHQINQLMASAISLEAHRASEAELARFGAGGGSGKGSSSRADAKRKYGW